MSSAGFWRNYGLARDPGRDALARLGPALGRIMDSTHRGCVAYLIELCALLAGAAPRVEAFEWEGDSMGDALCRLRIAAGGLRLELDYEDSITESWSSVENLRSELRLDTGTEAAVSVELRMNGSGSLTLRADDVEPRVAAGLDALGGKHFERYRAAWTQELLPIPPPDAAGLVAPPPVPPTYGERG